jgi:hypothetical protein
VRAPEKGQTEADRSGPSAESAGIFDHPHEPHGHEAADDAAAHGASHGTPDDHAGHGPANPEGEAHP